MSGDVIVKVQMVKIGAVKTIKFTSNTFVHEVIKRAAKQCAVNPTGLGLYRRSGLELDPDKTLAEEDVISNVRRIYFFLYYVLDILYTI